MPVLDVFVNKVCSEQVASLRKAIHDAHPDLLRILLRGKVKRLRKIVRGKSVASNEVHALPSVLITVTFIGKTKYRIRVLFATFI